MTAIDELLKGKVAGSLSLTPAIDGLAKKKVSFDPGVNFPTTAQSTIPVAEKGTPNIDPVGIFNSVLPGVKPIIQSVTQRSLAPLKEEFVRRKEEQDTGLYTIDGRKVGTDYKKVAQQAGDLVLGTMSSGSNFVNRVSQIARSKSATEIAPILKSMGVADDILPQASKFFEKVDNPEMVSKFLNTQFKISIPRLTTTAEKEANNVKIAISKDPSEISVFLRAAGVPEARIPLVARVTSGLSDPKKIQTIIDAVTPKAAEILETKQAHLEILKNQIESNPLKSKPNDRFLFDAKEGQTISLADAKSPKQIRYIEDRMAEAGYTDPQKFLDDYQALQENKARVKELEKDIKSTPAIGETLYHGTSIGGAENINKNGFVVTKSGMNAGNGVSLTSDKSIADVFGEKGKTIEVVLAPDAKLINPDEFIETKNAIGEKSGFDTATQKAIDFYKSKGYDGVDFRLGRGGIPDALKNEVRIWNTEKLQVKKPIKYSAEGIPMSTRRIEARMAKNDQSNNSISQGTNQTQRGGTTLSESQQQKTGGQTESLDVESVVGVPESIKGDSKEIASYNRSLQQTFNNSQEASNAFDDFYQVLPDIKEFPEETMNVRRMALDMGLRERAPKYKDIGVFKSTHRDIYRNTEQVFGEDFKTVKENILDKFDDAKGKNIDWLNKELGEFDKNIFKKFKPGSKESAAIQEYGEKKITREDLVKKFGDEMTLDIIEAERWFRKKYDDLIEQVVKTEKEIYPNNPEKWTPKRKDYFRHFWDLSSDFSRLQAILENPIKIDPLLVGISEGTKPRSKWASFKQQRLGIKTDVDAVGGYLNYLPSASYAINIDPQIGKFRALAEILKHTTRKSKNINNYINELEKFSNELSGKTAELDRVITENVPGGRTTLAVLDWVNKRVKLNTIIYNLKSVISQIFNVPQGIADAGLRSSAIGLEKTLAQNFIENKAMAQSTFIKERYFKGFNKFEVGFLNNTKKFGVWLTGALDEAGTKFIWNSQYEKALSLGVKDPVRYADSVTRKLVAGRGIGEKPLIQNSKVFQLINPFQLEVTNLWWAMEDMAKSDKRIMEKFGAFATLLVSLYLFNKASEKVTGQDVAFDPIQTTIDGVKILTNEPNLSGLYGASGRVAGEILSNMPWGQTAVQMMGLSDSQKKKFFGQVDPTRFGGGLLSFRAMTDPFYKLILPYGGGQLKKTIQGAEAIKDGKSTDALGRNQFPVGGSFLKDMQALGFGKYANEESQKFFEEGQSYAEAKYEEIKKSNNPNAELLKIYQEDPDLAEKILDVIEKKATGITKAEEKIKNMGVANKQRARAVVEKINDLDNADEKRALLIDYAKKGIVTDDVLDQVIDLLETPPKKTNILKKAVDAVFGVKTAEAAEAPMEEKRPLAPTRIKKIDFTVEKDMPGVVVNGKEIPIDKIKLTQGEIKRPITRITVTRANGKKEVITSPEQLRVANRIKQVTDKIRPEYTNYMLRLAFNESSLGSSTTNINKKDGSVDRGVFQINNRSFPVVKDEHADDLDFSILFAIALIDAGKQKRWSSDEKNKKTKLSTEN